MRAAASRLPLLVVVLPLARAWLAGAAPKIACAARAHAFATAALPLPDADAPPEQVVFYCMDALKNNDEPSKDAGKRLNWELGSDMLRGIHKGALDNFLSWSNKSPVFSCMVDCERFTVDADSITLVPGTMTRGGLAKMKVVTIKDGRERSFLWTLQQQRMPPQRWLLYQVMAIDKAFEMTRG